MTDDKTDTALIELSAYVYFDGPGAPDFGERLVLLGNLFPLEGGTARRGIMVPTGSSGAGVTVPVEPGRYICEVELPSGDLARNEVDAVAGETTPVVIDIDHSPYETHAWQFLMGAVESRDVYHSRRASRSSPTPDVRWYVGPSDAPGWSIPDPDHPLRGDDDMNHWASVQPVQADEATLVYRFVGNGPVQKALGAGGRRRFCSVRVGRRRYLVTLPAPWVDLETDNQCPTEMMVDPDAQSGRSPISVTVRDPRLGGGLGYFATGSLDLAVQMFADVEGMLYEKMVNPLAAAAGGYALVGTDDGRVRQRWYPWLDNLGNWQSWLPDGLILAATRRLRQPMAGERRQEAREMLVESLAKGVPMYTIGLRWLMDGLSAFAGDPEVDAAIAAVRNYSYRVDMTQPFVIARLDEAMW